MPSRRRSEPLCLRPRAAGSPGPPFPRWAYAFGDLVLRLQGAGGARVALHGPVPGNGRCRSIVSLRATELPFGLGVITLVLSCFSPGRSDNHARLNPIQNRLLNLLGVSLRQSLVLLQQRPPGQVLGFETSPTPFFMDGAPSQFRALSADRRRVVEQTAYDVQE